MSSKNIFEVLQNIAENTESNEKFLNILKENGFTGTLEEAENQINQQAQVVLNNLTTEDLQNIAGGKSLMNDKLKKAIAVGGASLMAAGTVMPSSLAANKNDAKKFADSALNYVKQNPVHTGVTSILGLTTAALIVKSIFGGKTVSDLPFKDKYHAFLREQDLSAKQDVLKFIDQLSNEDCEFELEQAEPNKETKIKFTKTKDNTLQDTLYPSNNATSYTVKELLFTLITAMDKEYTYVTAENKLTVDGAEILNALAPYIVKNINSAIETVNAQLATAKTEKKNADSLVQQAKEKQQQAEEDKKQADQKAGVSSNELITAGHSAIQQQKDKAAADKKAAEAAENDVKSKKEAVEKAEQEAKAAIEKYNTIKERVDKIKGLKLEMPKLEFKAGDFVKPETKDI